MDAISIEAYAPEAFDLVSARPCRPQLEPDPRRSMSDRREAHGPRAQLYDLIVLVLVSGTTCHTTYHNPVVRLAP